MRKTVVAGEDQRHTLYVFGSLELRLAAFASGAYQLDETTEVPYLQAHGVRLARVVHTNAPDLEDPSVRVFLELGDNLGSPSVVLDHATGELVERSTAYAYGAIESDYRPERWGKFREDYRFTGKEEDIEVGLQYFGKRFYAPLLQRWVSADPLAVHAPGQADLNLYAYVHGRVLVAVDPVGLDSDAESDRAGEAGLERMTRQTTHNNGERLRPIRGPIVKHIIKRIERGNRDPRLPEGATPRKRAIVLHYTGGSAAQSSINTWENPAEPPYGTHFVIDRDGKVIQTARLTRWTEHVGRIRSRCVGEGACAADKPREGESQSGRVTRIDREDVSTRKYPNRYPKAWESIGIEIATTWDEEKQAWQPPTPEQEAATRRLVGELQRVYFLEDVDVYAHGDISHKKEGEGKVPGLTDPPHELKDRNGGSSNDKK